MPQKAKPLKAKHTPQMPDTVNAPRVNKAVSRTFMFLNNQARGEVPNEEITKVRKDKRANGINTG